MTSDLPTIDDAVRAIYAQYWSDVTGHVQDIIERANEDKIALSDIDLSEEPFDTMVWEHVDSCRAVFITREQHFTMLCTENDDAWQDSGELGDDPLTLMAFFAHRADVIAQFERARERPDLWESDVPGLAECAARDDD